MKPNFTLILSADGLRLSHRDADRWVPVGTVVLESPDLSAALGALRAQAEALEPDGLRCRLVLPDDQIRYISFPAQGKTTDACREDAAAALDGVTVYAVDELAFDTHVQADQCNVAAVARETLEEAETFAEAYGFAPVSFAALPERFGDLWTPDFGLTARGRDISRHEPAELAVCTDQSDEAATTSAQADGDPGPLFMSRRRAVPDSEDLPTAIPAGTGESAPGYGSAPSGFAAGQARFAHRVAAPVRASQKWAAGASASAAEGTKARPPSPRRLEAQRLTIFGAREDSQAMPRSNSWGRVLVASLALGVVVVAGWSVGMTPPRALSFLLPALQSSSSTTPAAQFASPIKPPAPAASVAQATQDTLAPKVIPVRATLTDEDTAVLDALSMPLMAEPDAGWPPTADSARVQYAFSGVWIMPPEVPTAPEVIALDDLHLTSFDPVVSAKDAIALPDVSAQQSDTLLPQPASPVAAGTQFLLDSRGLVTPSAEGTLNPDGVMVYSGPPPVRPPRRKQRDAADNRAAPQVAGSDLTTAADASSAAGLATIRPQIRPTTAPDTALSAASLVPADGAPAQDPEAGSAIAGTAQAVGQSLRPAKRPDNYRELAAASRSIASAAGTLGAATTARATSAAPRRVAPQIPSNASVKREATVKNALNLRQVNLIGVFGKPSDRRALVRLSNGRSQKVKVGDRVDGGTVFAIGDAELRYQKNGRNMVLTMPKS